MNLNDFNGGWFIGDFDPSILKTKDFEVGVKFFLKDEIHSKHYHKKVTEINLVLDGRVLFNDIDYYSNDFFIVYPYTITNIKFLEDTRLLVVKSPSIPGDKWMV